MTGDASERTTRGRAAVLAGSLALAGVALVLVLGVAEVGFRLAGYTPLYDLYSKPSLFWVRDELLGWSHEPGAEGRYVGPRPFPVEFETPIRINSLGLRGPEVGPKEPGEYRVLVLGDSVAVGFEVAYEETFTALLEQSLSRKLGIPVRVVNAAVRGYGTDQSYLYYRERGRLLEPDLVLLVHSGNDPNDNITLHRVRRPFGKPAFAPREDGSLELVGRPVPSYPLCSAHMLNASFEPERVDGPLNRLLCFAQTRAADRSAVFTFVSRALGRLPGLVTWLKGLTYPDAQREVQQNTRWTAAPPAYAAILGAAPGRAPASTAEVEKAVTSAVLLDLARAVRADGRDFVVLIRPTALARLEQDRLAAEIDFRQVGAPRHVDPRWLQFKNDGHYNGRGHRVLADGLAPIIAGYVRAVRPDVPTGPLPHESPGRLSPHRPLRPQERVIGSARTLPAPQASQAWRSGPTPHPRENP